VIARLAAKVVRSESAGSCPSGRAASDRPAIVCNVRCDERVEELAAWRSRGSRVSYPSGPKGTHRSPGTCKCAARRDGAAVGEARCKARWYCIAVTLRG
jgi:hypothetical protein